MSNKRYTRRQGQYLAFIYYYTKLTAARPPKLTCKLTSVSHRHRCTRWFYLWQPMVSSKGLRGEDDHFVC